MEECYNFLQSESDLHVTFTGKEYCRPLHRYNGIRNHYVAHYIVKGEGILKMNDKTYQLTPGCAFFIFPGQKNFYQASRTNPWTYKWIGFIGSKAEQKLASINIARSSPVYRCEYSKKIDLLFDELFDFLKTTPSGYELKIMGIFYLILFTFLENSKNVIPFKESRKRDYIANILEFIEANYQRNISVFQMAEYLELNRSYFSDLFRKRIGKSVRDYLIEYRIDKAKDMLLHTNYNISEIAFSVGYNDYYGFIKSFKRITGFTPKGFKKRYYVTSVQFLG